MGSTCEATDQDMFAHDCSSIHPRLLGQKGFKPCLWPGYFLLLLSDSMLKTCMLLAKVGSMRIGDPCESH